jgi:ABC-type branched-subunit amino acid transport system substrate-binding protein
MQRTDLIAALLCAVGLCCVSLTGYAADDLTPAEARGKHIYTKGESTSSRIITATISTSAAPASASILPCIQCHGVDGRGIGILSPDINWDVLVDPVGHEHQTRKHGPYDQASLARAIVEGVDPAGNDFEATMPRYTMSDADIADLVAYLKRVDTERDPGLSATTIRIGTVLPTEGPLAMAGTAMQIVMEAYFDFVNVTGGIHGRDLELVVGEWGNDDAPAFWQALDLINKEPLFALIGVYMPGYEAEISALVDERQLPLIGTHTLMGTRGNERYEFFLQAGLAEQAEALVEAVIRKAVMAQADPPKFGIVYPRMRGFDVLAEAARSRAAQHEINQVETISYEAYKFDASKAVATLRNAGTEAILFLGSAAEFVELGAKATELGWKPALLAPGIRAESGVFSIPQSFAGEVYLAYASLPSDHTQDGTVLFEALHRDRGLNYRESVSQIAAFSAARVLVEALQKAGPDLSREQLILALEDMENFQPGLSAAVSFNSSRRMGPDGAHVVRVDLVNGRLDGESFWINLDERN